MIKVLIVDDSQPDLYMLETLLKGNGYDVATASNGVEALEKARHDPPSLIISDILMPEMDGFTLCRLWKHDAALNRIPFVFYTATYTDSRDEELALSLGAEKFIVKPADPEEFTDIIRDVILQYKQGKLVSSSRINRTEKDINRMYNETLIRKLEDKMGQIEAANHLLKKEVANRIKVEKEIQLLYEMTKAIVTSKDFHSALEVVLKEVCRAIGWNIGEAWLPSPDGTTLEYSYACHCSLNDFKRFGSFSEKHSFRKGAGLPGRVWSTGQIEWITDVTRESQAPFIRNEIAKECGIKTAIGIPIIAGDDCLAVLVFFSTTFKKRDERLTELVSSVASQLSLVIKQKKAEEEIRRRNVELALLTHVIEQTVESVIITDTEGIIVYVNPTFERITGYNRSEVIGKMPNIIKSGEHEVSFFQDMWATIKAGKIWRGQIINKRKDGTRYIDESTIIPVRDERGKIVNFAGIQNDATHDLQLEEQYRQMQKMEAIGQLTAGIAHDFNNIMTAVNGYSQLLQMRIPQEDPRQQFLNNIIYSGEKATNLIQQLLAFSRRQVIEPKVLNLNYVVDNLSKMLKHLIGEHVELKTILSPDLWDTKSDPTQIEQIIVNLAVNARDAMPDGGQLTIETSNVVLDDNFVSTHLETSPGDFIMLAVSDTGQGMNKSVASHIFEPFYTTKGIGKGTGLGLSTVYGIVKQNRGSIWIYSEEGCGTTFKIYLPRTIEPLDEIPVAAAAKVSIGGDETILVAEDDDKVRELVSQILTANGYKILLAKDGQEAIQVSNRHFGDIHLLLTDVIMPVMTGKILFEQITQARPGIKVLFMSGYMADMIGLQMLRAANLPLIQKPFNTEELLNKVRGVLDN